MPDNKPRSPFFHMSKLRERRESELLDGVSSYLFSFAIVPADARESVVEKLQRIGPTEYESRAYLALLEVNLNTARRSQNNCRIHGRLASLGRHT